MLSLVTCWRVRNKYDGVRVEDDLHVFHLCCLAVWLRNGKRDEMISIISLESHWDSLGVSAITSLVQGEAGGGGSVGRFIGVVRIFKDLNKWVLSWVQVLHCYTCGAAP